MDRLRATSAVLIFCFSGSLPLAAQPPLAPKVTLEPDAVVVAGVSPGGEVVALAVFREPVEGGARVVTLAETATDDDLDGTVSFKLAEPLPLKAVWVAIDGSSGALAWAVPEGFEARSIPPAMLAVVPGLGGVLDRLRASRWFLEVLLVRPGVGAWHGTIGDGGETDADGAVDGLVTAALADLVALGSSPLPPAALLPGDRVVLIDPNEMDFLAVTLAARPGGLAPEGSSSGRAEGH